MDRTGTSRIATTDPATMTVYVSEDVKPPLLDRVMIHEAAHAVTVSRGLLPALRAALPPPSWVAAEEFAASLVEGYGMEAVAAASKALGRPVCVEGYCSD